MNGGCTGAPFVGKSLSGAEGAASTLDQQTFILVHIATLPRACPKDMLPLAILPMYFLILPSIPHSSGNSTQATAPWCSRAAIHTCREQRTPYACFGSRLHGAAALGRSPVPCACPAAVSASPAAAVLHSIIQKIKNARASAHLT